MSHAVVKRDLLAGLFLAAIGAGVIFQSSSLEIGSLRAMQAGYLPIVLGILLTGLGLVIAAASFFPKANGAETEDDIPAPDLRGFLAIVLSVAAFIGIGAKFGLVPATFSSVIIAAAGDRETTVKGALILALVLVAVAVGLFSFVLKVPFPLVRW